MTTEHKTLEGMTRGMYFAKKAYDGAPLPVYEQAKDRLPQPEVQAHPEWRDCYDYALSVLFTNMHSPREGSGFVSNFVDAAFNADIFLWDTVFMTLFCNLLHPYVPGICSLDNFYCKQLDDGEIPRELVRETGEDFALWVNRFDSPLYSYFHNHYGFRRLKELTNLPYEDMYRPNMGRIIEKNPYLTLDNLNHPLLAFAEWESYCHTGDVSRLSLVVAPLIRYYEALHYHLRHQNGLYVTDWASMDNSPRNKHLGLAVDTSSEMVLFAGVLLEILAVLAENGYPVEEHNLWQQRLAQDKAALIDAINRYLWNEKDGFYYDLTFGEQQTGIKTVAGFFPLLAGVCSPEQAKRLAAWLQDPATFCRPHRVPCLAADDEHYQPQGGYWRGSVWAPTNAIVTTGLEKQGYHTLAKEIARNHLEAVSEVFRQTGTIWENYAADEISSGDADNKAFVGWSGLGPIYYFLRYGVGLWVDHTTGTLCWELDDTLLKQGSVGCKRYWFRGKTADFSARLEQGRVRIEIMTQDTFALRISYCEKSVALSVTGNLVYDL